MKENAPALLAMRLPLPLLSARKAGLNKPKAQIQCGTHTLVVISSHLFHVNPFVLEGGNESPNELNFGAYSHPYFSRAILPNCFTRVLLRRLAG